MAVLGRWAGIAISARGATLLDAIDDGGSLVLEEQVQLVPIAGAHTFTLLAVETSTHSLIALEPDFSICTPQSSRRGLATHTRMCLERQVAHPLEGLPRYTISQSRQLQMLTPSLLDLSRGQTAMNRR